MADQTATRQVMLPAQHFVLANKSYLKDPAFSDFIIQSQAGTEYNVHRHVISSHSKYFDRLCRGEFQESATRRVTLHDDHPKAVRLMVEFFYAFDYDVDQPSFPEPSRLVLHAMVFMIADKYEIQDLKAHALRRFEEEALSLSDIHAGGFRDAVAYIYTHLLPNDSSLRQAAVRMWRHANNAPIKDTGEGEWEELVGKYPAFGSDMIKCLGESERTSFPTGRSGVHFF